MRKNDLKKSSLTGRMVLFLVYHPTGSLERGRKKSPPKQKAKIDGKLRLTTKKVFFFPSRSSNAPESLSTPGKAAFTPEAGGGSKVPGPQIGASVDKFPPGP